jgi:hypothetical protein
MLLFGQFLAQFLLLDLVMVERHRFTQSLDQSVSEPDEGRNLLPVWTRGHSLKEAGNGAVSGRFMGGCDVAQETSGAFDLCQKDVRSDRARSQVRDESGGICDAELLVRARRRRRRWWGQHVPLLEEWTSIDVVLW